MPFQFRKEAIEEDLNSNFPSQGQGNPPLYYSLSEVVVPTYSINQAAEGTSLPLNLQTAWDFSTGLADANNSTVTAINNTGFWLCNLHAGNDSASGGNAIVAITDGLTSKPIWSAFIPSGTSTSTTDNDFVVFLRSGDSCTVQSAVASLIVRMTYRQIADVNGNLVNPLGFSFA